MREIRRQSLFERGLETSLTHSLIEQLVKRNLTVAVTDQYGCLSDGIVVQGSTKVFGNGLINPQMSSRLTFEEAKKQARRIRLEMNDPLGISVITDLHYTDVGKSLPVYLGFDQKGKDPWVDFFVLETNRTKRIAKLHIVERAFSDCLLYTSNSHNSIMNVPYLYLQRNQQASKELALSQKEIERLIALLRRMDLTLATAESCTGGAIANCISDVPGSEDVFLGGVVTNNENAKIMRGVPIEVLTYGQVYSKRVALAMADAMQKRSGADIVFSTTGVMENMDTRPYHEGTEPGTVFITIFFKDASIPPIVEERHLEVKNREEMKIDIASHIFKRTMHCLSSVGHPKGVLASFEEQFLDSF